jgi:hypothetical protein
VDLSGWSIRGSPSNLCSISYGRGDPARRRPGRPTAAPLDQCAELPGVDLATIQEVAASVEPSIHGDGSKI